MQDERATEEGQAAIGAAIQILSEARRSNPPQVVAPLPRVWKSRNIRIGHAEFELDRLAFFVVLILVAMYGVMALAYVRTQSLADDEDRALALVTTPDVSPDIWWPKVASPLTRRLPIGVSPQQTLPSSHFQTCGPSPEEPVTAGGRGMATN